MKYIFITGGVASSLGKGVAASSLGCILKSMDLRVNLQKMDPYINLDAGNMSPFQHGEVFVTKDGMETDLDIGNYERFVSISMTRANSITTGQIYDSVISAEREGKFLGQTVQVVPHITNEIQSRILGLAKNTQSDVLIVEIGGTVGDMESIPFLEALRQFPRCVARENILYIHVTLIPWIGVAEELKTKPTQHSVQMLRSAGICPDVLLCRSAKPMTDSIKEKLSLFCDVEKDAVVEALDLQFGVDEAPLTYHHAGLTSIVAKRLNLPSVQPDLSPWIHLKSTRERLQKSKAIIKIALVGKYTQLKDSYKSLDEAIRYASVHVGQAIKIERICSETLGLQSKESIHQVLRMYDGFIICGGFGERGLEGKVATVRHARKENIPIFGICLGMQVMLIEFARSILGLHDANSTEFDVKTLGPVVVPVSDVLCVGEFEVLVQDNSFVFSIYQSSRIAERFRHRYGMNSKYVSQYLEAGLHVSAVSCLTPCFVSEHNAVPVMIELKGHPWFVGVQFHPEFKSGPLHSHVLFDSFLQKCISVKTNNVV